MDLQKQVKFSDTIFAQEVDGEMVLLDMNSENYFGLDEVGTSIWQAIKEHNGNMENVFAALMQMYDVEAEVLKKDLLVFLEKLKESGLVEIQDE